MSNLVESFQVLAASGLGLVARPMNPDDQRATAANVTSIDYASYDESTGTLIESGTLDPADVFLDEPANWAKDLIGYTLRWPAPGTLWPLANKRYRVQMTITSQDSDEVALPPYILAWQANTQRIFGT